jgi:type II secretory pathway predicted ATPase ExeA
MSRPIKINAAVVAQVLALRAAKLSISKTASAAGVCRAAVKSICAGTYNNAGLAMANHAPAPLNAPIDTSVYPIAQNAVSATVSRTSKKLAPVISNTTEAVPLSPETETAKEEPMLLRHLRLSRQACDHFKITRDPFVDELHGMDDVFITDSIRDVRAALRQTAKFGGMLAVVGEVGSGKSILRRDLHEWINQGNEPITVVEPYVTNMEDNDTRGKNLRTKDIEGTVIRALDPHTRLAANTQDRTLQMHKLLKASAKLGQKHVIVVEEAHALSIPTLKHLKRLYELDDGFRRLLGIILIGQTELELKLSERNAEVREMVGRCAVVHVSALDNHVGAYLRHKFERVGLDAAALIAPDAIEEITARLRQTVSETWGGKRVQREQSLCYPLAINNLLTRAMNEAVKIGAAKVTAGLIVAATREVRT